MSDTYNYEVLEPGGHARLVGNVLDRISEASANPASAVGSSRAMLGDPETASWMERTTAADGAALIEAVYGNTIVQDGSLLPVRMEGVETVGFNQWDEEYLYGQYNAYTGEYEANTRRLCSKYPISIAPNTAYYVYTNASKYNSWIIAVYYDANMNYLSYASLTANRTFTTPANAHYMHFNMSDDWGGAAYDHDICINISDPARNGEYEPHWSSQRTIPAATYFPQGLRSAGTVYDELRADAAVTRVGERAYQSGDESDASVITDGTVTHYALATPTTTPIDPPLPMSYRVGAGGTERVMVASGTTSAPPIFVTRYPLDPADLAASIAPVDGPIAEANHAVGDLVMLGWTLCKVTTAIARGEAITIGTNVTRTSVATEIAALS